MTVSFPQLACLVAALPLGAMAQTYVDLDFSGNVQPASQMYPNNSTLGPYYSSAHSMDFANAGTYNGNSVDVRVSFLGLTDGEGSSFRETSTYQWVGWIPDYNDSFSNNDLGVYYRQDGNLEQPTGGIAWSMSFFLGGSDFQTEITLPGVRLLVYDHDGETLQAESIRAFGGNGLVGYQLHDNSEINVLNEDGSYRFDSRGSGHPETTADGGMILYYENTSSIRFDMFGTTYPGLPPQNLGIFAAWDGNLGVNGGNTNGFGDLVTVPEPTAPILLGIATAGLLLRRTRQAGNA
ncbi:PEP-CTERM sorting domain-containing protein [Luteolibacter arcticus]|uniref:PEP-CTERM sorting domain-containing protein n=1 Tax=Luteolibacter arcticus TaxID=1581411 RepID=A0ABT3GRW9_9BACT|nr:PEP-CTERM sorting domain-containing protein [Luteolibacter arcticus]MCW1926208.1 PEP-CTERM sorting domain-containing protein [Luteolibacter arcticus]